MYWGGAQPGLPVKWHDIRVQARAQGPVRVRRPSFEQRGEGPAEAGRGGVDRRRGGDEPKSGHSSFVREKDREWWKAEFRSENRHGGGPKTVGDPSLHLPPMDLHFAKEPFGGCEQVSAVPNYTQGGRIHISEITQREFRKAYRNEETTEVVKFSQTEKQIYLRRINISTELAIRDKEEQRNKTRIREDSLENLVLKEYHDLLPAFEKGEKTSLPPHRPGIDLEINMEDGKGLPEQKIYPLRVEEPEAVQEYIRKNKARGWIR